ncbi:PUA-like domain-containing protein [Dactylonectria estremocensis]|uniref:Thymocyte nuclear protein 1 n=1 Tax=Dactylonectria estremocensis TaxID=1079267 RepID=A0A9P9DK12_9HYPO|nr:PUA-like domain-containing protein [Dactylonectria estremocensis]
MPPRKRNAPDSDATAVEPVLKRRSLRSATRSQTSAQPVEPATKPVAKSRQRVKTKDEDGDEDAKASPESQTAVKKEKKPTKTAKAAKTSKPGKAAKVDQAAEPEKAAKPSKAVKKEKADKKPNAASHARAKSEDPDIDSIPTRNPDAPKHDGEWYWLMKAEPETRIENGIDVRFSIDDLRAKDKPEGWDGIRAYPARNNMRNMNAGDKAFFYHSNCKEPAIVGIMEIVKEFSEDRTARQPGTPYYDPSSTKEKPKWDLVHVEFRKKFAVQIGLKELRELGKPGGPLETMQMLKQSRLSVSRVSKSEWEALCEVADRKAKDAGLEHEED